jgi:drug/metabolite transporter (DMT)-like permease
MEHVVSQEAGAAEERKGEEHCQESLPAHKSGPGLRSVLAAGLTVVLWASAFPGIRMGLLAYSPVHLALLRYMVAALTLTGYALATRMRLPRWRDWPGIAVLGMVGIAFYNLALNTGEVTVQAAVASFLITVGPLLVAMEAQIWLSERITRWGWLGMLIGFGGVAVIAFRGMSGFALDPHVLLVLSAALAQSLYFVGQKPLLTRYRAIEFTTYAVWVGACLLLVFLPGLPEEVQEAPIGATIAVIYLGIFPGAIGFVSWAYALSHLPAARVASFLYLVPLLALGISWVWLGELPPILVLLGGLLVLVGVMVVNSCGRSR